MVGDDVPQLDLLLPCCGEDIDVILDTILSAAHLDYPGEKLRILVLDDGNSEQLEKTVWRLNNEVEDVSIYYAARGDVVRFHSKAANLDFGLNLLNELGNGAAPFFAVLDIDMIPEPEWLRASLPVLLEDNDMALVNTPQRWYNLPKGYSIADYCIHNQDIGEHLLDQSGNANCVGTGFVARRAAFDGIGGYPHTPLQDDTVVPSYMLKANGWRIAQLPESMQYGLQVVKFGDIAKQQAKWMLGHLATIGVVMGPEMRTAPIERKLGMLFTIWNWGISRMLLVSATVAVPLVVLKSKEAILVGDQKSHRILLSLAAIWQLTLYVQALFERQATGCTIGMQTDRRLWVLPYEAKGALRLCRKKLFASEKKPFKSTGAESSETDDPLRLPFARRLWHVLWQDGAHIHATFALCLVTAVILAVFCACSNGNKEHLFSATYPPLLKLILECLSQASIPFQYVALARPLRDREDYVIRDKESVVSPKQEAKQLPVIGTFTACFGPALICALYVVAFILTCIL